MDLHDQLDRLGLRKGTDGLGPGPRRDALDIHHLVEGEVIQTAHGNFFLTETHYPLGHQHGVSRLAEALGADQSPLREFLRHSLGSDFDLHRAAFIDTETTGLAGGTGTYAFLVGVGIFEEDGFRIRQFFMRDYHEEKALLHHLAETVRHAPALVSFNGRTFDVPLLHTRWITARLEPLWTDLPHLDLLPPSRRLWRSRLGSCSLASLEQNLLDVHRAAEDVPGWLIPSLYFRYLQTRDAQEMKQVLYHNLQDILSMVTLAHLLCQALAEPLQPTHHCLDSLSLARWFEEQGKWEKAETLYRRALAGPLPPEERRQALLRLSFLLKRQDRRGEAASLWEGLAPDPRVGLVALEELAKWEEWHTRDLEAASRWTELALGWSHRQLRGYRRRQAEADLQHRLQRLQRKLSARQTNT